MASTSKRFYIEDKSFEISKVEDDKFLFLERERRFQWKAYFSLENVNKMSSFLHTESSKPFGVYKVASFIENDITWIWERSINRTGYFIRGRQLDGNKEERWKSFLLPAGKDRWGWISFVNIFDYLMGRNINKYTLPPSPPLPVDLEIVRNHFDGRGSYKEILTTETLVLQNAKIAQNFVTKKDKGQIFTPTKQDFQDRGKWWTLPPAIRAGVRCLLA